MNKKSNLFLRNGLFVLISIFGLGVITLLTINPIIDAYIKPALLNSVSESIQDTIEPHFDFVINIIKLVPYVLFGVGILYLLILIFKKEQVTYYG